MLQEGARDVRITWRVDFSAEDVKTGKTVYFEAKGFATEVYKLKLKIFKKNPKGYLEIWGGSYKNPKLLEIVDEKLI